MNNIRHPDEVGGGGVGFLVLMILVGLYSYFVIYDSVGNFKQCDAEKYPLALVCVPSNEEKEVVKDAFPEVAGLLK